MSKRILKHFAMLCVVVIFVGMMSVCASAAAEDPAETEDTQTLVVEYTEVPLFVDGEFTGTCYKLGAVAYVPMLAFCESMLMTDFESSWDQDEESVYLHAEGIDISFTLPDNFIVANGRYIYLADGAYNVNGTILVPIRELSKIFNVEVVWDEANWSIDIDTTDIALLQSGDEFYDQESLYWLSRVISTEAGGEPLEGRIGVGNVVLNRLADESGVFADSVKGVIFQVGQFAVVESGAIYLDPNEGSVAAAKMCLEGYNTVGESKFFLNPAKSSSEWFKTYKTFVITILDHDFYA